MRAALRLVAAFLLMWLAVALPGHATAADAPPMLTPGKFTVSSAGAFTYSVPIAVPPGTAGMAPALSLDYSSHNPNGLQGLGWSLGGLPTIIRCPRNPAQDSDVRGGVNFNSGDRFCMDGQRLVAIDGAYGAPTRNTGLRSKASQRFSPAARPGAGRLGSRSARNPARLSGSGARRIIRSIPRSRQFEPKAASARRPARSAYGQSAGLAIPQATTSSSNGHPQPTVTPTRPRYCTRETKMSIPTSSRTTQSSSSTIPRIDPTLRPATKLAQ